MLYRKRIFGASSDWDDPTPPPMVPYLFFCPNPSTAIQSSLNSIRGLFLGQLIGASTRARGCRVADVLIKDASWCFRRTSWWCVCCSIRVQSRSWSTTLLSTKSRLRMKAWNYCITIGKSLKKREKQGKGTADHILTLVDWFTLRWANLKLN